MLQIGVIGAGDATSEEMQIAFEIGREIAKRGHTLITGGLGGVMMEASRGARSHGGLTIGILPGDSKKDANEFIDVKIVTAMSHARNALITRTSDSLIAVGGGAGTISEISLARKIDKPVILIRGALPSLDVNNLGIIMADTPSESVKMAVELGLKFSEGE